MVRVRFMQPSQQGPPPRSESRAVRLDPAACWGHTEGLFGASNSDSLEDKTSSEEAADMLRS